MSNNQEEEEEEFKLSNTHFDAVKLLEGALQKMDGIISSGISVKNIFTPSQQGCLICDLLNFLCVTNINVYSQFVIQPIRLPIRVTIIFALLLGMFEFAYASNSFWYLLFFKNFNN